MRGGTDASLAAGLILIAACASGGPAPAQAAGSARPRLVVVVSLDQFRPDYLTRFEDLFLPARDAAGAPGGFGHLMEQGAWFLDARHDHYPLVTGPGNAATLTGAFPYRTGIVGNDWYERSWGKTRNCVEDPNSPLVGKPGGGKGISPAPLLVTTIGDELKVATGGGARVWSVAIKNRTAVLLAGHLADGALWYDEETGSWITSRHYARGGGLPAWARSWNEAGKVEAFFGTAWTLSVPDSALGRLFTPGNEHAAGSRGLGARFPHRLDGGAAAPGPAFYAAFRASPHANAHVLEAALDLVRQEGLGADEVPDLLAVGLSATDYAGHEYGPDSAELLDVVVRTDRQLAAFLGGLRGAVPGGLAGATLVVTADHGVAPIALAAREAGLPAGVYAEAAVRKAAEEALDAAFGADDWIAAAILPNLYLSREALDRRKVAPERAEEAAAAAVEGVEGIYAAYGRGRILAGRLPATEIAGRVGRSFHPERSGDLIVIPEAGWVPSGSARGAAHGSPNAYDTAVPVLLAGAGIRPGRIPDRVSTLDIAPTLAVLLGVQRPSGSEGRILGQALAAP